MSQKRKAKTKKEMKKSINNLYKDLMKEKAKHAIASKIIGHLRSVIHERDNAHSTLHTAYTRQQCELNDLYEDRERVMDISADLMKRMNQDN